MSPMATEYAWWDKEKPISGICCSCGYSGKEETPCSQREDKTHCEHWWDGADEGEALRGGGVGE